MASGTDKALHAAELVTAREPLDSPALGTMAAFQGVPAPQTTDNALLSTDAHLLETQHDTSTFSEDHSPVVQLGDAEIEKSQLPSDTDWPPADKRSISYFKLYRLGWEHALLLVKSYASLLLDMSLMNHMVFMTDTAMDGIISSFSWASLEQLQAVSRPVQHDVRHCEAMTPDREMPEPLHQLLC